MTKCQNDIFYIGGVTGSKTCTKVLSEKCKQCRNYLMVNGTLSRLCFNYPVSGPSPVLQLQYMCYANIYLVQEYEASTEMGIGLRWFKRHTSETGSGAKVLLLWWSSLLHQTPRGSLGRPRDAVIQDPLRGHESVQKMEGSITAHQGKFSKGD